MPYLSELDRMGVHYYFQVTLNDYVKEGFEPDGTGWQFDDDRSILCYDHSKNGCYDKGGMNQKKNDSHSIGKWEDDIPNQHGILFMS